MSPLSASIALAMAACGARGNTEAQFRNVLHLPTSESVVTSGYQSLIDNLNVGISHPFTSIILMYSLNCKFINMK